MNRGGTSLVIDRNDGPLLVTENITADGRIEMLDDWFNPSPEGDIQDWLDGMKRLGESSDAVLLGRRTFADSAATGLSTPTSRRARTSTRFTSTSSPRR